MWFGLMHLSPEEGDDVEEETVVVVAYERHRLFKVAAPLPSAPDCIATLRKAADHGRNVCAPYCPDCGADWDIPDLDSQEEEDEACASA